MIIIIMQELKQVKTSAHDVMTLVSFRVGLIEIMGNDETI
jgi:hypothetical protein